MRSHNTMCAVMLPWSAWWYQQEASTCLNGILSKEVGMVQRHKKEVVQEDRTFPRLPYPAIPRAHKDVTCNPCIDAAVNSSQWYPVWETVFFSNFSFFNGEGPALEGGGSPSSYLLGSPDGPAYPDPTYPVRPHLLCGVPV